MAGAAYGAAMVTEKDISMICRFVYLSRTTGEVRLFQAASPRVADFAMFRK